MLNYLRRTVPPWGVKLNLGCGGHSPAGWVGCDYDSVKEIDVAGDGCCLPFRGDAFSQVMLCHVLEHVDLVNVERFLVEVRRVMSVGGQLLVVCPDINSLMHHYIGFDAVNRMGGRQEWTGRGTPYGSMEIGDIFEDIFGLIVLEDDFFERDTKAGDDHLPHSDHRWNTYGRRLLEKVSAVFPNSRLLGTDGIADFGHECVITKDTRDIAWTDPQTNLTWDTAGWTNHTCAVLATK
tara:strand:+ start:1285 stop:1992 length:708 start_codon:yes stop_codon:yes gene_type:complete